MTFEQLKNSGKLFVSGSIGGEEFSAIFEEFYSKFFDYDDLKKNNPEVAKLVENINEDASRFEPNNDLRLTQPDHYIDEEKFKDSVKRLFV